MIKYSFIVPVYNRAQELDELLASFEEAKGDDYEIIVVEDGSKYPSDDIIDKYSSLPIVYQAQENQGPGPARNTGARLAKGEWLLFLDSDTILSFGYFDALKSLDSRGTVSLFGGPDTNHPSFSPIQIAIGYSMTSFLSTGGIRGSKRSLEKFKPRSFNMGVKKDVFDQVGGFANLRFGEDMDLSLRLEQEGYLGMLLEEALVFHKRRTSFRQFFKQVFNSGIARIVLSQLHPGTTKIVHLLPLFFVLYHMTLVSMTLFHVKLWVALLVYPTVYFLVGLLENKSLKVAILATVAVYVQLFGYGIGFAKAVWVRFILRRNISYAYRDTFYEG